MTTSTPQPKHIDAVCEKCGAAYRIGRPRAQYTRRLCRSCRGKAGGSIANKSVVTPESTKAQRLRANGLVNMRIRRGDLIPPTKCQKCGEAKKLDKHHPDYNKPAEVLFLCRSCHMTAHRDPNYLRALTPIVVSADTAILSRKQVIRGKGSGKSARNSCQRVGAEGGGR